MIKIIYDEGCYNYGNVGKQPYDIHTELKVIKDASLDEAMQAFITTLKIAGYSINRKSILDAVEDALAEIDC